MECPVFEPLTFRLLGPKLQPGHNVIQNLNERTCKNLLKNSQDMNSFTEYTRIKDINLLQTKYLTNNKHVI